MTIALNAVLLFLVMVYVYPLKFLFVLFAAAALGVAPERDLAAMQDMTLKQGRTLFTVYGPGFAAVMIVLALMNANAFRQRAALDLNAIERLDTRVEIVKSLALACVGLASVATARLAPDRFMTTAGWVYAAIGAVEFVAGYYRGRRRDSCLRPHEVTGYGSTHDQEDNATHETPERLPDAAEERGDHLP